VLTVHLHVDTPHHSWPLPDAALTFAHATRTASLTNTQPPIPTMNSNNLRPSSRATPHQAPLPNLVVRALANLPAQNCDCPNRGGHFALSIVVINVGPASAGGVDTLFLTIADPIRSAGDLRIAAVKIFRSQLPMARLP